MKQARSEVRKQAKVRRLEKAAELQSEIEDRAAARRLERELAEMHRSSIRWAARFKVQAEPKQPKTQTSPVHKRSNISSRIAPASPAATPRPPSSWIVDDLGFKGIIWQQSYLGRKSSRFRPGAARGNWEYIVRDEAVLLDASGQPIIVSNMGDDWIEIGAAWQVMEDASTRANAKIQMLAIAPFDSEMSQAEMVDALTHFCKTVLEPLDLPYAAAIHKPPAGGDSRNFHPHITFSLRPMQRLEPYTWEVADEVCGELDGRDGVQMLRHLWAHSMTEAAERAHSNRRYTELGYGARRLDQDAGEHLGEARAAIVARGGYVHAHERNRIVNERNALRRAVRDADRKIEALTKIRDAALARITSAKTTAPHRRWSTTPVVIPPERLRPSNQVRAARTYGYKTVDVQTARSSERTVAVPPASSRAAFVVPNTRPHQSTGESRAPLPARQIVIAGVARDRGKAGQATASGRPTAPKMKVPSTTIESARRFAAVRATTPAITRAMPAAVGFASPRRVSAPVRPAEIIADSTTASSNVNAIEHELRQALTHARARQIRALAVRRKREAPTLLADLPVLFDLPERTLSEASLNERATAVASVATNEDTERFRRLTLIDAYVADYGAGPLDISSRALKAIGGDEAWLVRPPVQRKLAVIRAEQQQVLEAMIDDADTRPLAYAKAGTRFWPRDLSAEQLKRLDHWATDPGFQQDVFPLEQRIYKAHSVRDAARRSAAEIAVRPGSADAMSQSRQQIPDGFGGWRATPPPRFVQRTISPRFEPFDLATGAPTGPLLRLLRYSGRQPHQLAFADDGKLMTLPGASRAMEPLLQLWRDDARVEALLVETITASRAARRPVWPAEHAAAIERIGTPISSRRRGLPHTGGMER